MGERHALLIATAHYTHPRFGDLSAPYEPTRRLADDLRERGRFDSVRVLLDGRKANIEFEIERLYRDRRPDDLLLLSLAGHGFAVDGDSLPEGVEETHVSLFDGSNCGIALTGRPVFSVQHHPEASPGPQDSHYLFRRFINLIRANRKEPALAER